MSYGTFSTKIINHYNRVNYTLNGKAYNNISIFKTNPETESIAPAVYEKGNKQLMVDMVPPGISASNVIAKINGGAMEYGKDNDSFYGLYYVNNSLYKDNFQTSGISDDRLDNLHTRYFPCFCIKSDGTATIRWPLKPNLPSMLTYCSSVIGACHPLVYNSLSVFENAVNDTYDGDRIAQWGNLNRADYHYNDAICSYSSAGDRNRTLLGHKSDGSFFMVCAASVAMNLRVAAKLMCDLGCDYAVNLDGSAAVQMRVAPGYSNNYAGGQMTVGGTYYYGTAICAYLL